MFLVTAPLYTAGLLHTESLMISTVTSIRLVEAMPVVKTRMCLFLRVLKKDVEVGVLGKHRWSYALFGTKQIEVTIYKPFSWLSSVSKYISLNIYSQARNKLFNRKTILVPYPWPCSSMHCVASFILFCFRRRLVLLIYYYLLSMSEGVELWSTCGIGNSNHNCILLLCLSSIGEIQFSVILFQLTYILKVQFVGFTQNWLFLVFCCMHPWKYKCVVTSQVTKSVYEGEKIIFLINMKTVSDWNK